MGAIGQRCWRGLVVGIGSISEREAVSRLAASGGLAHSRRRPRTGLLPRLVLERAGGIGSAARAGVQGRQRTEAPLLESDALLQS